MPLNFAVRSNFLRKLCKYLLEVPPSKDEGTSSIYTYLGLYLHICVQTAEEKSDLCNMDVFIQVILHSREFFKSYIRRHGYAKSRLTKLFFAFLRKILQINIEVKVLSLSGFSCVREASLKRKNVI